jgi:ABC-type Fe3+-hydroxamate transport system substrate-binding protein
MTPHTSVDQMGTLVQLSAPPQRIVSLVPSQTELLFDLGLADKIVGVTKFCVHPDSARQTKTIIGGTKKFDLDRIAALKPDLAIGNKEENYPEGIEASRKICPVWMSDIYTVEDALEMISGVSGLTRRQVAGERLVSEIKQGFEEMPQLPRLRTLYLMWHNPWMGAASRTFIHDMMTRMGLVNVLSDRERYPDLDEETLTDLRPELVLLSSEPFHFKEKQKAKINSLLPQARVMLVDGELFSWYGSRLRIVPAYVAKLAAELGQK